MSRFSVGVRRMTACRGIPIGFEQKGSGHATSGSRTLRPESAVMPRFFFRRVRGEGRTLSRSDAMHSETGEGKCDFAPAAGYASLDAGRDED